VLHTGATTAVDKPDFLDQVADAANFGKRVQHLGKKKAGGPDGVVNEVLKHAPLPVRSWIQALFTVVCVTGHMPQQWCRSTTTLLYKKGDALDISKWRPIALANTLYKLYTSMLTGISSTFAEACGILSISQEGFRAHRRTAWQLQMLVSALENARLLGRDVYALYIDFSSASNMVDHDKLFRIMLDLGFPARYTGAHS
jgi:hypothetical protein